MKQFNCRSLPINYLFLIGIIFWVIGCKKEDAAPVVVVIPTVTTVSVSSVSKSTATGNGDVKSNGNGTITQRGVIWSKTPGATIALPTKATTGLGSNGTGAFSANLVGLEGGTTYFFRAFATNSVGTGYGSEISFTTLPLALATVTTGVATDVMPFSATVSGTVTGQGDGSVTDRGIVYKTSVGPTITDLKQSSGTGTGAYTAALTGLTQGTTYFARAFATTSVGTAYGAEIQFTTAALQNLSLRFDGTDDYVSLATFNLSSSVTIESWVYWEGATATTDVTSNWQRVFDFNSGTGKYMFFTPRNNDGSANAHLPRFGILALGGTEQTLTGKYRWSTNRWHHVAVVLNGTTGQLYIDGVLEDSKSMSYTGSTLGILTAFWLGRSPWGDAYFKGRIDEVRIWSTARTLSQINSNMNVSLTGTESGLVAYYQFESQATANGTNITYNKVSSKVSAADGTLFNFALTGSNSNWTTNYAVPAALTLGQSYEGGKIAYIDATGLHGFIATTSDQNASASLPWSPSFTALLGTSASLTSGLANSMTILSTYGASSGTNYAAYICLSLDLNGFDDWYLPSKDQLEKMDDVDALIGNLSGWYWSSTEFDAANAYDHQFPGGSLGTTWSKTSSLDKVRAVRTF